MDFRQARFLRRQGMGEGGFPAPMIAKTGRARKLRA
jgi:hypothetical protein